MPERSHGHVDELGEDPMAWALWRSLQGSLHEALPRPRVRSFAQFAEPYSWDGEVLTLVVGAAGHLRALQDEAVGPLSRVLVDVANNPGARVSFELHPLAAKAEPVAPRVVPPSASVGGAAMAGGHGAARTALSPWEAAQLAGMNGEPIAPNEPSPGQSLGAPRMSEVRQVQAVPPTTGPGAAGPGRMSHTPAVVPYDAPTAPLPARGAAMESPVLPFDAAAQAQPMPSLVPSGGFQSLPSAFPQAPNASTVGRPAIPHAQIATVPPARQRQALNPRYTFETFVSGANTRLAFTAAVAAAESPGKAYNPLVIYGESGLGKTHLLHAIGNYANQMWSDRVVVYVSTEEFTNDFIASIRDGHGRTRSDSGAISSFQAKYREADILLIDDIQFIERAIQTQEEFFHTFNALHTCNKQIVISSDRPPRLLTQLEDRLRSRFEWGLVADIHPPDFETRTAILGKKAALDYYAVPQEVLELIAERVTTNIRELEGALTRVVAMANLESSAITLDSARRALKDYVSADSGSGATLPIIMATTADYYQLRVEDLTGPGRQRALATARQVAMYLSREMTDQSLPQIGAAFSRDHTTVIYAVRKIEREMAKDRAIYGAIAEIKSRVLRAGRN